MPSPEVSSISSSLIPSLSPSQNLFEPSKPLIPRLISNYQTFHKTLEAVSHVSIDTIEREHQELKILSQKEFSLLQKKAECALVEESWSTLSTVANYTATACNLGLAYLLSHNRANQQNAWTLLAVGGLNALHLCIEGLGGWDRTLEYLLQNHSTAQDRLKTLAPMVFFLANTLLTSLSLRHHEAIPASHQTLVSLLKQVPAGLSAVATLKDHYLKTIKSQSEMHIAQNAGQIKYHQDHVDLFTTLLDLSIQQTRSIKTNLKKPILSLIQANSTAAQKV
ncbi:MAG: hypothetical protein QRY71_01430 [Candidatus Rhabdochlamydia sp.]